MKLSLREAFDLEPRFELKLGERTYSVPPLTFGRFQELLRCDFGSVMDAVTGFDVTKLGKTPEEIGRVLAYFPTEAFKAPARAIVPGLRDSDWTDKATPFDVFALFLWFAKIHDWPFIGMALDFENLINKGKAVGPTTTELAGALLSMAKELGCTVNSVLELRLEGFYLSAEAIKERSKSLMEADQKQGLEEMHATLESFLPVTTVATEAPSG